MLNQNCVNCSENIRILKHALSQADGDGFRTTELAPELDPARTSVIQHSGQYIECITGPVPVSEKLPGILGFLGMSHSVMQCPNHDTEIF